MMAASPMRTLKDITARCIMSRHAERLHPAY
jgi:hypothetical protein